MKFLSHFERQTSRNCSLIFSPSSFLVFGHCIHSYIFFSRMYHTHDAIILRFNFVYGYTAIVVAVADVEVANKREKIIV